MTHHPIIEPMLLAHGKYDSKKDTGELYDSITWQQVVEMVTEPTALSKSSAKFTIPSTYIESDGRNHNAQREHGRFWVLPIDIDDGNPTLAHLTQAIESVFGDVEFVVYSSSSSTAERRKFRGLIPLADALPGDYYHGVQSAAFDLLDQQGLICDRVFNRAGQPVYLPNVPNSNRLDGTPLFYQYHINQGARFELSGSQVEAKYMENEAAEEEARQRLIKRCEGRDWSRQNKYKDGSIVDKFNAAFDVEHLLGLYGYTRKGQSDDWASPYQTSGSFATRVMPNGRWVSLSGSDAAAGVGVEFTMGCFGDSFDLYTHYEHRGDFTAAIKAAAIVLDLKEA